MEQVKHIFLFLKSPELVASFQRKCGVHLKTEDTNGFLYNEQAQEVDSLKHRNGYSQVIKTIEKKNGHVKNGFSHQFSNGYSVSNGNALSTTEKNGFIKRNSSSTDYVNSSQTNLASDSADLGKSSFKINNIFCYVLFHFGASLGNEIFYLIFFPFVFWNLDGTLMRQMAFVWHVAMWSGQALKDIICWPRPASPPVIKLEDRYNLEYGMPSTHATVGTVIPFSLFILSARYYEFSFAVGLILATCWMLLVGCSRIYLGMHTALDVIAGYAFACVIIPLVLPWVQQLDHLQVTHPAAPLVTIVCYFLFCWVYPKQKIWNTARADTANVHGICGGVATGYWLNFQLGWLTETDLKQPFQILPLSTHWLFYSFLRTLLGVLLLAIIRGIFKPLSIHFLCKLYKIDKKDIEAQRREGSEVPQKFITYYMVSVGASFLFPLICSYLGIMRTNYYNELY